MLQSRSDSNTSAWTVAFIAVGLLGSAITYIVVNRSKDSSPTSVATNPSIGKQTEQQTAPQNIAVASQSPKIVQQTSQGISGSRVSNRPTGIKLLGSYRAYIGEADRFASDGFALSQPWQILRQDRANVHRYGIVDSGDEGDPFFVTANNRAIMERMVMRGTIDASAANDIVAGGVTVSVSVYGRGAVGEYVDVTVN